MTCTPSDDRGTLLYRLDSVQGKLKSWLILVILSLINLSNKKIRIPVLRYRLCTASDDRGTLLYRLDSAQGKLTSLFIL